MNKEKISFSILSGVLLFLSFPPFNYSYFAYVAFIPVLIAIEDATVINSFYAGCITGFFFFLGLLHWIYIYHVLALPFLLIFLTVYFGITIAVYKFISSKLYLANVLIFPIIWVSFEFFRATGYWGFPWGILGYTQYNFLQLIQVSKITGVFGISFLVVLINIVITRLILSRFLIKRVLFEGIFVLILFFGLVLYGFDQIDKINKAAEDIDFKIGIMQFNFSPYKKWTDLKSEVKKEFSNSLRVLSLKKADLIITPETLILDNIIKYNENSNNFLWEDFEWKFLITRFLHKSKSYLLLGIPVTVRDPLLNYKFFNSAILVSPTGTIIDYYHKIHLVPFGETVPYYKRSEFIRSLANHFGCSNFDFGNKKTVFRLEKASFSTLICYEILFGDLTSAFVKNGADFLVNITNDAWTKSESAHYQHSTMSIFSAVSNNVPLIRVGNSGVSQIVYPDGQISIQTRPFTRTSLVEYLKVFPTIRGTFFSRYGNIFSYFISIINLILFFMALFFPKKPEDVF